MSSKHGVFCESDHGAFIESPHGVRGCDGPTGVPLFMMYSWQGLSFVGDFPQLQVFTPIKSRLYRVVNGRVVWKLALPDLAHVSPGGGVVNGHSMVEFNNHGLFVISRVSTTDAQGTLTSLLTRVQKVDPDTGSILATYDSPSDFSTTFHDHHFCANLEHIYLINNTFNWIKLSPTLQLVDEGVYAGPFREPGALSASEDSHFGPHRNAALVTPSGNPRMRGIELDRDDPSDTAINFFDGPVVGFFDWGPGLIRLGNALHWTNGKRGAVGGGEVAYKGTDTGLKRVGIPTCIRIVTPTDFEMLYINLSGLGDISAYDANNGDLNEDANLKWDMDLTEVLADYLDQSPDHDSLGVGETMTPLTLRHGGTVPTLRVIGWIGPTGHVFACDMTRGSSAESTPVINWYLDSRSTPPGDIPIEVMDPGGLEFISSVGGLGATGVMGSGEHSVMTPLN